MKLYVHYCAYGFGNCYVLGTDYNNEDTDTGNRKALIIDPGMTDQKILKSVEGNNYNLEAILITHDHLNHVRGLRTLKRIYDVPVYSVNPLIRDHRTVIVHDGDVIDTGSFKIEIITVPGHSTDSTVFKIGELLFTGDVLSAGLVGSTASNYAAANQITALRGKILSLPGNSLVLPAHGPPATLEAERKFNKGINEFEEKKAKRSSFKLDFDSELF